MIDRALTLAGLGMAFIAPVVRILFPKIHRYWPIGGFAFGTVLIAAAVVVAYLPANADPSQAINAPGSGNIIQNNVNGPNILNQTAKPELVITSESGWIDDGAGVHKDYGVKLENPGSATKVRLIARGENLLSLGFIGDGMLATGDSSAGDGWVAHELLTPASIRGFQVTAKTPTAVRLEASFY